MLTKQIRIDEDMQAILMAGELASHDGQILFYLPPGQLDRLLYERVNRALEALGGKWNRKAGAHVFQRDPREQFAGLIEEGKTAIAKDGFFPTPPDVIAQMLDLGGIGEHEILEPSAGDGAIVDAISARWDHTRVRARIWCIEQDPERGKVLATKGYRVIIDDFLKQHPGFSSWARFDRVYMNPPFEQGQDIEHVMHAYGFLVQRGVLVSVMSEGTFIRSDRKAIAFRDFCRVVDAEVVRLPGDAFAASGTKVNTRLVNLVKL